METGKIYASMANIMSKIEAITKDRKNEQQGFKFRGIDDVMNALHSYFKDERVFILPEVLSYDRSERTNKNGTAIFTTIAKIKYSFVADDGSKVESTVEGEAMDSGDKGMNKAMSIALKYLLLQTFLIPTEEDKDPDAQTHEVKSKEIKQSDTKQDPALFEALNQLKKLIEKTGALDELEKIWNDNASLHKNSEFVSAVTNRKKIISNA